MINENNATRLILTTEADIRKLIRETLTEVLSHQQVTMTVVPDSDESLISIKQLCEAIGTSRGTVYRQMKDRKIPYYRIGRRPHFKLHEVLSAIHASVGNGLSRSFASTKEC